jgi:hypothetical protein
MILRDNEIKIGQELRRRSISLIAVIVYGKMSGCPSAPRARKSPKISSFLGLPRHLKSKKNMSFINGNGFTCIYMQVQRWS